MFNIIWLTKFCPKKFLTEKDIPPKLFAFDKFCLEIVCTQNIWLRKNVLPKKCLPPPPHPEKNHIILHESSSWFEIRLHAENQPPGYPGNGLKV